MVSTRTSKRKKSSAANSNDAKASTKAKRSRYVSDDEAAVESDHPLILVSPRESDFNETTWWMVDLNSIVEGSSQGASALVKRCMRTYGWDETKARKVLAAYRQFLVLKKELKDWNAEILSPCYLVDQMWHCHILDVVNYCHDMMLLCGHVVGHNPDGALDYAAKQKRDATTLAALKEHFESYDEAMWNFSPDAAGRNVLKSPMKSEDAASNKDDTSFTIRIKDQTGEEMFFKALRSVKMGILFKKYAERKGVDVCTLRFSLDGEVICYDETPAILDMQDEDLIFCMLQQLGC